MEYVVVDVEDEQQQLGVKKGCDGPAVEDSGVGKANRSWQKRSVKLSRLPTRAEGGGGRIGESLHSPASPWFILKIKI